MGLFRPTRGRAGHERNEPAPRRAGAATRPRPGPARRVDPDRERGAAAAGAAVQRDRRRDRRLGRPLGVPLRRERGRVLEQRARRRRDLPRRDVQLLPALERRPAQRRRRRARGVARDLARRRRTAARDGRRHLLEHARLRNPRYRALGDQRLRGAGGANDRDGRRVGAAVVRRGPTRAVAAGVRRRGGGSRPRRTRSERSRTEPLFRVRARSRSR